MQRRALTILVTVMSLVVTATAALGAPPVADTATPDGPISAGAPPVRTVVPLLAGDDGRMGLAVDGEFLARLSPAQARTLGDTVVTSVGLGWFLITDSSGAAPADRARTLSAMLGVAVVPNGVSRLLADNTEPDAGAQWPLDNAGTSGATADADIDGEEAWDISTGVGSVVAVLDSGTDLDHPDLAGALWTNPGETPGNGQDDDNNGFIDDVNGWDFVSSDNVPDDPDFHGSFVSGIIAAPINGVGMAGVAPDAELMVLRVCGVFCFDSDVIAALTYAADNGAHVANLSLGRGPGDTFSDDLFQSAVEYAIDNGVTVVAAAGNDGADNDTVDPNPGVLPEWPTIPSSFPLAGLLSVAMTNDTDSLDTFSNFGATTVDLGAPGVDIYSTNIGGGYALGDGTSFAAPHVAGVAALIMADDGCLSPAQVETRIKNSTDDLAALSGLVQTGGRLNAYEALVSRNVVTSVRWGGAPHTVDFDIDTCSGSYPWTFGDGGTANGPSTSHAYTTPGIYMASVDLGSTTKNYEVVVGVDFNDTTNFLQEINWLAAAGVTLGCDGSGNFCPEDTVTRGQMASFLARALGLPAATDDYFGDDTTSTHQDNINRLREAGITLGCDADGTQFCPDEEITREQMATFLVRGYLLPATSTDFFSDDAGVHELNINALAASGITLGCDAGLFCPKDAVIRKHMAAFLFRAD